MSWTLTVSKVSKTRHYLKWKVVCTSDGSSCSATDLIALMPPDLARQEQALMKMKVVPGTAGVAPDTTIDITLTDDEGDTLWADTGISNVANSWHTLSADIGIHLPVFSKLYLAVSDIGGSGDQVTLYFISWME
jgi:hypothetical protein